MPWRKTTLLILESLEMMERVKPASWAARLVLRRRGYAGTPVDRFVTGVVTGVARSIGLVDRVCRELWPEECRNPRLRNLLRLLVYVELVDERMRRDAREALSKQLSMLARERGVNVKRLEELGSRLLDPVEARLLVARWIYERLARWWGRETAEKILLSMRDGRRVHWLRVNRLRAQDPEGLVERLLRVSRGTAEPSKRVPYMVAWRGSLHPLAARLLDEGLLVAQDESAAAAGYMLSPRPGERILDACAAPGGKTSILHELAPGARIVSVEVSYSRTRSMLERLYRLRAWLGEVVTSDARSPPLRGVFDAILLDPPCTSTGVLDKSPDARWQDEGSVERLSRLQYELLEASWRLLRRGGRLLYVTCSLLPEENELLVKKFLEEHSDAELVPLEGPYSETPLLPGALRAWPHIHETGGMFYALLEKRVW